MPRRSSLKKLPSKVVEMNEESPEPLSHMQKKMEQLGGSSKKQVQIMEKAEQSPRTPVADSGLSSRVDFSNGGK